MRPQFWKHENVQYWYADADTAAMTKIAGQLGVQPFTRLAGPVKSAAGSTVYAYKLAGDYPPAWVASAMIKAPQKPEALGTVLDPRFDQRTVAIVDTSATGIQAAQIQTLPGRRYDRRPRLELCAWGNGHCSRRAQRCRTGARSLGRTTFPAGRRPSMESRRPWP